MSHPSVSWEFRLEKPDLARENRNFLRSLYSVIKSCDASLHFSFLTGVSKFSKVSLFSSLDSRPDEASSTGNLDMAVTTRERIILFEFKTVQGREGSGQALQQIKNKGYAGKHLPTGKPVHLVGVEFSIKARNVALVQWERAGAGTGSPASSSAIGCE